MIRMQEWADIVAAYHRGVSIKEIVRTTGLSRNTVRKAIRSENAPRYERPPVESKLDPYKDYLLERLDEYPRISVERLYAEISTIGYTGKKTILADFTRPYRKARRRTSDIRFETALGHQAQVDWAELGCHVLDGKRTRVSIFVMVLGYSRMIYAEVVTDETSATFLACHEHAFSFFGGITEEILYDNAKVVALKHDREKIVFNASLLDFAGHYGYTPRVCKPYHPQTKGKVERTVRYIRDSFLEAETFYGLEEMQDRLVAWPDNVANRRIHATTHERPCELLLHERLRDARPYQAKKSKPLEASIIKLLQPSFKIADAPKIETRPLSFYEETAL